MAFDFESYLESIAAKDVPTWQIKWEDLSFYIDQQIYNLESKFLARVLYEQDELDVSCFYLDKAGEKQYFKKEDFLHDNAYWVYINDSKVDANEYWRQKKEKYARDWARTRARMLELDKHYTIEFGGLGDLRANIVFLDENASRKSIKKLSDESRAGMRSALEAEMSTIDAKGETKVQSDLFLLERRILLQELLEELNIVDAAKVLQ